MELKWKQIDPALYTFLLRSKVLQMYSNDRLKGVLTIRSFNNASVWNLRQMKTQKIEGEMKWDPWFWSDMSCIMYKDITRSRLNSFTIMDLIHLLLFFIMKTKMILILKLLFSWSCLIEIIIVMLHVDSCYYSSSK